jgi:hypothetical protein
MDRRTGSIKNGRGVISSRSFMPSPISVAFAANAGSRVIFLIVAITGQDNAVGDDVCTLERTTGVLANRAICGRDMA